MRSYKVYGVREGDDEVYVDTAYSATEGKDIHLMMKVQGYFDEMVVRDCLGGVQMRRCLRTGENLMVHEIN